MAWSSRLRMSLARKISLLFGAAVLVIIAVTLFVPWLHMDALHEQSLLWKARRVGTAAYLAVDWTNPDWRQIQAQLEQAWKGLTHAVRFEIEVPPRVIRSGDEGPGFQKEAMDHLTRNTNQHYYWRHQHEGRVFRFAMAVRGTSLDAYPRVLRGIIDVSFPAAGTALHWNTIVTVLAGASGALLALLVFYMVTQRLVLTPLGALRTTAERVAAGDLTVRSVIESGDEFGDLSDAFNKMLFHLRDAQENLQTINRSLDVRLGELAETNLALYESNRLKGEFLANVTHELRTPLVSIIGFAELLRDLSQNAHPETGRLSRYAQNILTSGRSLLEIINDLLDLAKIEAGKMELHLSEFSPSELCQDLLDFVRPLAEKREQKLVSTFSPNIPRMKSDSGKIKQILYNLLSNAIKFTPVGGTISLAVGEREGLLRMVVSDTGPGIPESERTHVFEKFYQTDGSATREHAGTGLGLAITRDLVALLGGTIELEPHRGNGAVFVVVLPLHFEREPARTPRAFRNMETAPDKT